MQLDTDNNVEVGVELRSVVVVEAAPGFKTIAVVIVEDVEDRADRRGGGPTAHVTFGFERETVAKVV